jgi:hypothetical protein
MRAMLMRPTRTLRNAQSPEIVDAVLNHQSGTHRIMLPIRHTAISVAAAVTLAVPGCAGNPLSLPAVTAALDSRPPSLTLVSADPPAEAYSRIARGALRCWFGPEGSLKRTHIFNARVDPQSKGGAAEIVVQTREPGQTGTTNGSLRAFSVSLAPNGNGSLIETRNVRFPEDLAASMSADVARWNSGKDGCAVIGTGGWAAAPPPPPAPESKKKPKPRKAKAKATPGAATTAAPPSQPKQPASR